MGESLPASASACPSDFAEKLMEEPFEEEEAESRDMAEVEQELDGNSPGELSEKSVGGLAVLSSAASLCCGGQEEAGKASADSQTPGGSTFSFTSNHFAFISFTESRFIL